MCSEKNPPLPFGICFGDVLLPGTSYDPPDPFSTKLLEAGEFDQCLTYIGKNFSRYLFELFIGIVRAKRLLEIIKGNLSTLVENTIHEASQADAHAVGFLVGQTLNVFCSAERRKVFQFVR
jgi:hypothetical protein